MAREAEVILQTLDRHLTAPGEIRLLGGAALILAYGMDRSTEDADLLLDDPETELLIEESGFAEAVEATNQELADRGLYLTHIWGPEQQILTPEWRESCRRVESIPLARLRVTALGPLDLILSKLCRADDLDLADISHLIRHERLAPEVVREAMQRAVVPEIFSEVYPESRRKVEALLSR
ncbi:MAG: hypothetical protein M3Y59_01250 [Myxococcota bacterium]|nr:hypothetical protein [Myxococcota bacterium]